MSIEIITEAIVLDKEDIGECDSRIFLYTKDYGKVVAKATSARKITSKLASHLEPLDHITIRLISKGDNILDGRRLQIADALLVGRKEQQEDKIKMKNALKTLRFISRAVPEGVIDSDLWNFLHKISVEGAGSSIQETLEFLGFGAGFASCQLCFKPGPEYFYPQNNIFVCQSCMFTTPELKENIFKI